MVDKKTFDEEVAAFEKAESEEEEESELEAVEDEEEENQPSPRPEQDGTESADEPSELPVQSTR